MGCSHSRIRPTYHRKDPFSCHYKLTDSNLNNHKTLHNGHGNIHVENNNSMTEEHSNENGLKNNTSTKGSPENVRNGGSTIQIQEKTESDNNTQKNNNKHVRPTLQRNGSAFLEQTDSMDTILSSKAQQQHKLKTDKNQQKNNGQLHDDQESVDSTMNESVVLKSVLKPSSDSIQQDFIMTNRPQKSVTFVESVMFIRDNGKY